MLELELELVLVLVLELVYMGNRSACVPVLRLQPALLQETPTTATTQSICWWNGLGNTFKRWPRARQWCPVRGCSRVSRRGILSTWVSSLGSLSLLTNRGPIMVVVVVVVVVASVVKRQQQGCW